MYFLIIMAFALVLSDSLPPRSCNLFTHLPMTQGSTLYGTLAVVIAQIVLLPLVAHVISRRTQAKLNGSADAHDDATDYFSRGQQNIIYLLSGALIFTMVFTPWSPLVLNGWKLDKIPLIGDLIVLAPLFISIFGIWIALYPAELKIRSEAILLNRAEEAAADPSLHHHVAADNIPQTETQVDHSLSAYLIDKFRHQVLILAAPMCLIVLAKHLLTHYAHYVIPLPKQDAARDFVLNTALGTVSFFVLLFSPVILRYIWATEPLPPGPLRDRFVSTCKRIGLRYREILLWRTHGTLINAAVMGFIAPLRYILVSDALLETMDEDEIEAVFGHEAGHVRHWHLPCFGLFAIVSMYLAGGSMLLLFYFDRKIDAGVMQLVTLGVLLGMWLFGFAWLSRKFERQADLYGVRCITPDIKGCVSSCPVHGDKKTTGLCVSAANVFGRTLGKIADLNGIPREAPSWRHGSIESRCNLIERFSHDATALRNFDRRLVWIKVGLVTLVLIGTGIAVKVYYQPMLKLLGWWK